MDIDFAQVEPNPAYLSCLLLLVSSSLQEATPQGVVLLFPFLIWILQRNWHPETGHFSLFFCAGWLTEIACFDVKGRVVTKDACNAADGRLRTAC